MKINQYVVAKRDKQEKPFLARIHKVGESSCEAVLEKDIQFKKQLVTLEKKHIKVNLGLSPLPGRAYGLDLDNLFRRTIEHDFWGNIHFFVDLEVDQRKMLKQSLDRTAKVVEKLKLAPFTRTYETEIRAPKGKWAGMMIPSKDSERLHRVWYAPSKATSPEFMDYVVLHEMGHVVRHVGVRTNKMRNRWLRYYQRTIAPVKVGAPTLKDMLNTLGEYDEMENSFRSVFKTLTDEAGPRVGKAILQWMKETHRITPRELEIMWRASKTKDLSNYWPDHEVDTHELKPVISDYATKNIEETFAETFAFYCQKKKLPEKAVELMEHSLSVARTELET